ncbi:MAG: argininosuccinate synthase domain-containing protein [Methylococcales bacterium]
MSKADVNKVVLAYSGGLDTSVILKWLQEQYDRARRDRQGE